jgi:hypothetical protein
MTFFLNFRGHRPALSSIVPGICTGKLMETKCDSRFKVQPEFRPVLQLYEEHRKAPLPPYYQSLIFPVVPSEKAMDEYRPKKRINVVVPVDLLNRMNAPGRA